MRNKKWNALKVTLLIVVLLIVVIVLSKKDMFWKGILSYNAFVSTNQKIRVEDIETTSLESEESRLTILLEDGDYALYNMAYIENGAMISGKRVLRRDAEIIMDRFVKYKDIHPIYSKHRSYALRVAQMLWMGGMTTESNEIMDEIEQSFELNKPSHQLKEEFYLTKTAIDMTYGDFHAVKTSLSHISGEEHAVIVETIKKYISEVLKFEMAYEPDLVDQYIENENLYSKLFREIYEMQDMNRNEHRLDSQDVYERTDKTVVGQVTIDGKPYRGAIVYEKYQSGMRSGVALERHYSVTDDDGQYEIKNICSDMRMVGIMIPWQVIHDKQWQSRDGRGVFFQSDSNEIVEDFEFWPGAEFKMLLIEGDEIHYQIQDPLASRNRRYRLKVYFEDPKYSTNLGLMDTYISYDNLQGTLSLEALKSQSEFSFMYMLAEDTLNINGFMEPLYLSGNYYFKVFPEQINSDGTITNGLFSDALSQARYVQGQDGYSRGDKLLENKKVMDAIQWYTENPTEHGLKVVYALYKNGFIPVENESYLDLEGADPQKALKYLNELIDRYGTSEKRLIEKAELYEELGQYSLEKKIRKKLLSLSKDNVFNHIEYARCMMQLGDYDPAMDYLLEYGAPDKEADRYYSKMLIGHRLELLPQEMQQALNKTKDIASYYDFHVFIKSGDYDKAWTLLQSKPESSMKTFYTLLMLDGVYLSTVDFEMYNRNKLDGQYTDFIDYYVEKTLEMGQLEQSDKDLAMILKYIKNDHNWFHTYTWSNESNM